MASASCRSVVEPDSVTVTPPIVMVPPDATTASGSGAAVVEAVTCALASSLTTTS